MKFLCWGSSDGQAIHGVFETDEELLELLENFKNDYGFENGCTVQEVFESLRSVGFFKTTASGLVLEIQ